MSSNSKKLWALLLTLALVATTVPSRGIGLYADETDGSSSDGESIESSELSVSGGDAESVSGGDAVSGGDTPTVKVSDGQIYLKVSGNGNVNMSVGEETYSIYSLDDRVFVENDESIADVTDYATADGYLVVPDVEVGTVVDVYTVAEEGYTVGTYKITIDGGAVEDFSSDSDVEHSSSFVTGEVNEVEVAFDGDGSLMIMPMALAQGKAAVRGDFKLHVSNEETGEAVKISLLVINLDTGEWHVALTTKNGNYDSSPEFSDYERVNSDDASFANSKVAANVKNNILDYVSVIGMDDGVSETFSVNTEKLLTAISNSGMMITSETAGDEFTGIWFSKYMDGGEVKEEPFNGAESVARGSLPEGRYALVELPCEHNKGYSPSVEGFRITRNGANVDLGVLRETEITTPITIQAKSYASDTQAHTTYFRTGHETFDFVTEVELSGLNPGSSYVVAVRLFDWKDAHEGKELKSRRRNPDVVDESNPNYYLYDELGAGHEYNLESVDSSKKSVTITIPGVDINDLWLGKNNQKSLTSPERIVAYIYVYEAGKTFGDSEPMTKAVDAQNVSTTVTFPTISQTQTIIIDKATKSHVGQNTDCGGSILIDTVKYSNIAPYRHDGGEWYIRLEDTDVTRQDYRMVGTLYDITSGEPVATSITGQTEFTPENYDGSVDVQYTLTEDTDTNGKSYASYIELQIKTPSGAWVTVADFKNAALDYRQIHYVGLDTTAIDADTGNRVGVVVGNEKSAKSTGRPGTIPVSLVDINSGNETITDTVTLTNLIVGETYKLKSWLQSVDGNEKYSAVSDQTLEFEAEDTEEVKTVTFEVDSKNLYGKSLVVYEELYYNNGTEDVKIARHDEIDNEDQMIHYPDIWTLAIDDFTLDEVGKAGATKVVDTVQYENLIVGQKYTLEGILVDKATGEPLLVDGKEVKGSTEIDPVSANGTAQVEFDLDGTGLQGCTIVVYETLRVGGAEGVVVRNHQHIDDLAQTLYFPKVETLAKATSGLQEQLAEGEHQIADTVTLTNLVVGKSYTLEGRLVNKNETKAGGAEVAIPGATASQTFTADNTTKTVSLFFTLDTTGLDDNAVVAYEVLKHKVGGNTEEVAIHDDVDDMKQTVTYPKLESHALDTETGLDEGIGDNDASITDTVSYYNLEEDGTYTIKGTLYKKETNEPYKFPDGYWIIEYSFVAKEGKAVSVFERPVTKVQTVGELEAALKGNDSAALVGARTNDNMVDGEVVIEYKNFNAEELLGYSLVSYNYLFRDGVLVGKHADIADENQVVKYIKTTTLAIDSETGTQESDYGETTVKDTISFENLTAGRDYLITTTVVEKGNERNVIATEETEYHATQRDDTTVVEVTFDSSELEGKTFVLYETLKRLEKEVSLHKDNSDKQQTIYFPEVSTKAYDNDTKGNEGWATAGRTFVDDVKYSNLTDGDMYTVKGQLYVKRTGQPLLIDGKPVTAEVAFKAGTGTSASEESGVLGTVRASGTVKVEFNFDATSVAGEDLIAVEYIYNSKDKVVGHSDDLTDEDEVVSYPYMETSLVDTNNDTKDSQAGAEASLTDTVTLKNLREGHHYTVKGKLYDRETGEPIEVGGKEVTGEYVFDATSGRDYTVEVVYEFDSSELEGTDVVSYEMLYWDDHTVGNHTEIGDAKQTVAIINIHTEALDSKTDIHENLADAESVIVDTVDYVNLYYPNEEYTLEGTLIHKQTGNPVKIAGTETYTVTKKFTPTERDGSVEIEFPVDTSELKNNDLVSYVKLYKNGTEVAVHNELGDSKETVYIPKITTEAWDSVTGDHEGWAITGSVLVDTVKYDNLTFGETYVAHAVVHDKETGEVVKVDGKVVEGYQVFTAGEDLNFVAKAIGGLSKIAGLDYSHRTSGKVDVAVEYDATTMSGKDVVVYEYVYRVDSVEDIVDNMLVARHEDQHDEAQVVSYPYLDTSMVDAVQGTHDTQAVTGDELVDTVNYENVRIGNTYIVKGTLYDKATGDKLLIDGEEVTAEGTFTATGSRDGKIDIKYTFDSSELAGTDVVSQVMLYRDGYTVGNHTDINDDLQRVAIVDIDTEALDAKTNIHESLYGKSVINDTITYENLYYEGEEYRVVGKLVNGTTGDTLMLYDGGTEVEGTFTVEDRTSEIVLTFAVDTELLRNNSVVVYATLYHGDKEIAVHHELSDADETVYIPDVDTVALDAIAGTHEGWATEDAEIVDTVHYDNLTYGETYVSKATLYDVATGEPVIVDGKTVEVYTVFEAGAPKNPVESLMKALGIDFSHRTSGDVEVRIHFDATSVAGHDVVVFEKIYRADSIEGISENMLVGRHEELLDEDQTISYPKIETYMTDSFTGTQESQALEGDVLVDLVTYENLRVGNTYTLVGTLMDKETGEVTEIVGETTFTPAERSGKEIVRYEFDSSEMAGQDLVSFEILKNGEHTVANHEDIEDEKQRVAIIDVATEALDIKTGTHESLKGESLKLVDTVAFENLLHVGEEYTLVGSVYNRVTGEELAESEVTKVFEAGERDGSVVMEYEVPVVNLDLKSVVVYVALSNKDGVVVATHRYLDDDRESVFIPSLTVDVADYETGYQESYAGPDDSLMVIANYENLSSNETYVIKSALYYAESGAPYEVDGKAVETYEVFRAGADEYAEEGDVVVGDYTKRVDGTVNLWLDFDATDALGKDLVVYTWIYRVGTVEAISEAMMIARYDDLHDSTIVNYPMITTELMDKDSKSHEVYVTSDEVLTDVVSYENVEVGAEYTVYGVLVDKKTGELIDLRKADKVEAVEEVEDFDSMLSVSGGDVLYDGEEYEEPEAVDGVIPQGIVKGNATFTATAKCGVVNVEFKFDSRKVENREVVAYEILTRDGYMVADHQDLKDKEQTMKFNPVPNDRPGMRTEATDKVTGTHTLTHSKKAVITDKVEYWNLSQGETYWLHTILYDKTKGIGLVDVWSQFKADYFNPVVSVDIVFDSRPYAGDTLVVFEGFYTGTEDDRQWVLSHAEEDDEAQTITVPAVIPTELIETGDFTGLIALGGLAAVIIGFVVLLMSNRRRKKF